MFIFPLIVHLFSVQQLDLLMYFQTENNLFSKCFPSQLKLQFKALSQVCTKNLLIKFKFIDAPTRIFSVAKASDDYN